MNESDYVDMDPNTHWYHGIPSQCFQDDSINIWQLCAVIKIWQPSVTDHGVKLSLCLGLYLGIEKESEYRRKDGRHSLSQ